MKYHRLSQSGVTLVEVLIVSSLIAVVFGTLITSFTYTANLINNTQAKLSALSVANDRMEYLRSLPYDEVGVVAGDPPGLIPQTSTTTLNGITFNERVRIDWVNDPGDDVAGVDGNGIIFDYKKVRLEYVWEINGATSSVELVSNIVPRSIETTTGGGTARINVLDADASLLPGASVRMIGSSTTFPYDVTNFTNSSGVALFNVRADSGYQIEVTANIGGEQYSFAQTYEATTTNPNPIVSPFTVLEADVSTLTFQIGDLSDLDITTYSVIDDDFEREEFDDLLAVASSSDVTTVGGELRLDNNLGVYESSGSVFLGPITPAGLTSWHSLRLAREVLANTDQTVQIFTGPAIGPYTLVPEIDLPGNAVGFTDNILDLTDLDATTYPSIIVGINLVTTDTSVTPSVDEATVFYRGAMTPLAGVDFDLRGNKIIGTELDATPIYKYTDSFTSDASGEVAVADLEFDDYTVDITSGQDIASACPAHPYTQQAGIDGELELLTVPGASDTLRVRVVDITGRPLPGLTVNLERPGYDVSIDTDNCGQAFFTGGVARVDDYELTVSGAGFTTEVRDPFEVNGDTFVGITMSE